MMKTNKASFVGMWKFRGRDGLMTLSSEVSGSFGGCDTVIILFIAQFLGSTPPKNDRNSRTKFLQASFQVGMYCTCKRYSNKAGMKTCRSTTILQNNDGKERQENCPLHVSVAHILCMQQMWGSFLALNFHHCCIVG